MAYTLSNLLFTEPLVFILKLIFCLRRSSALLGGGGLAGLFISYKRIPSIFVVRCGGAGGLPVTIVGDISPLLLLFSLFVLEMSLTTSTAVVFISIGS